MALLCHGQVQTKVCFVFDLFDFTNSGSLSRGELCMLFSSAMRGVCAMKGAPFPPVEGLERLTAKSFGKYALLGQEAMRSGTWKGTPCGSRAQVDELPLGLTNGADGDLPLRAFVDLCQDDPAISALLSNLDTSVEATEAFLGRMLARQKLLLGELAEIEAALEAAGEHFPVDCARSTVAPSLGKVLGAPQPGGQSDVNRTLPRVPAGHRSPMKLGEVTPLGDVYSRGVLEEEPQISEDNRPSYPVNDAEKLFCVAARETFGLCSSINDVLVLPGFAGLSGSISFDDVVLLCHVGGLSLSRDLAPAFPVLAPRVAQSLRQQRCVELKRVGCVCTSSFAEHANRIHSQQLPSNHMASHTLAENVHPDDACDIDNSPLRHLACRIVEANYESFVTEQTIQVHSSETTPYTPTLTLSARPVLSREKEHVRLLRFRQNDFFFLCVCVICQDCASWLATACTTVSNDVYSAPPVQSEDGLGSEIRAVAYVSAHENGCLWARVGAVVYLLIRGCLRFFVHAPAAQMRRWGILRAVRRCGRLLKTGHTLPVHGSRGDAPTTGLSFLPRNRECGPGMESELLACRNLVNNSTAETTVEFLDGSSRVNEESALKFNSVRCTVQVGPEIRQIWAVGELEIRRNDLSAEPHCDRATESGSEDGASNGEASVVSSNVNICADGRSQSSNNTSALMHEGNRLYEQFTRGILPLRVKGVFVVDFALSAMGAIDPEAVEDAIGCIEALLASDAFVWCRRRRLLGVHCFSFSSFSSVRTVRVALFLRGSGSALNGRPPLAKWFGYDFAVGVSAVERAHAALRVNANSSLYHMRNLGRWLGYDAFTSEACAPSSGDVIVDENGNAFGGTRNKIAFSLFDRFDRDKDGKLDFVEINELQRAVNGRAFKSENAYAEALREEGLDIGSSGKLSYTGFLRAYGLKEDLRALPRVGEIIAGKITVVGSRRFLNSDCAIQHRCLGEDVLRLGLGSFADMLGTDLQLTAAIDENVVVKLDDILEDGMWNEALAKFVACLLRYAERAHVSFAFDSLVHFVSSLWAPVSENTAFSAVVPACLRLPGLIACHLSAIERTVRSAVATCRELCNLASVDDTKIPPNLRNLANIALLLLDTYDTCCASLKRLVSVEYISRGRQVKMFIRP